MDFSLNLLKDSSLWLGMWLSRKSACLGSMKPWVRCPALSKSDVVAHSYLPSTNEEETGTWNLKVISRCKGNLKLAWNMYEPVAN